MTEELMKPRVFKGRPVLAGTTEGRAEVSSIPFDTCTSYVDVLISGAASSRCRDRANAELFDHDLRDVILCIPQTIGSTSGTTLWMTIIERDLAPRALCFANPIDATAASGLMLSEHWLGKKLVTVDRLGQVFLDTVKTGDRVAISDDGTVEILARDSPPPTDGI